MSLWDEERPAFVYSRFDGVLQKIMIHIHLGINYHEMGRYEEGRDSYLKSMEFLKSFDDPRNKAYALNGLSNSYYYLEDYQRAREYAWQNIRLAESIDHLELLSLGYKSLVYASAGGQHYDSAFHYFERYIHNLAAQRGKNIDEPLVQCF